MTAAGKNNRSRLILLCGCFAVVLGMLLFVSVKYLDLPGRIALMRYTKISSPSDLSKIKEDPDGKYVLTCDIDMQGYDWTPFSFSGILDGNGYAIRNLSVTSLGKNVRNTYDGNMKVYETTFAGLFDVMEGAEVRNLTLSSVRVEVETDSPCFAGTLAGYMSDSVIRNCTIDGTVFLRAHDRMFGTGGVIGYGCGLIESLFVKITLVCIDTDRLTKDEQFMGGVCAAGYPDVVNCTVEIDGYGSEHGYAHNGGILGMYEFYPEGTVHQGRLSGLRVFGQITFFEENEDRRAYCKPIVGEAVDQAEVFEDNGEAFQRNEVYEYDVDLLPEG